MKSAPPPDHHFDLTVIGNDEAAIELGLAAASRHRTLVVLPESRHSAWMMSQALRRLITVLQADRSESRMFLFRRHGTPSLLQRLLKGAVAAETTDQIRLLRHAGADVLTGEARFCTPELITVATGSRCSRVSLRTTAAVIATGVRYAPVHRSLGLLPSETAESLFEGAMLPEEIRLVGGNDVAAGLAALFGLFGVRSRLITTGPEDSVLHELAAATGVRISAAGHRDDHELFRFSTGVRTVDCRRAMGFTEHLNLPAIGVEPDECGQLWCSRAFETWCPQVFGVGSVVGFGGDERLSAARQADRVLDRVAHRVRSPNYLRSRLRIARLP